MAQTLPLTAQQEKLWRYIRSCEVSPTFEEMSLDMFGRPDLKGNIHKLIGGLEQRGYVRRSRGGWRKLVAIEPGEGLARFRTSELLVELKRRGFAPGLVA